MRYLFLFLIIIFSTIAESENTKKLEEASEMMRKAMILLKEVSAQMELQNECNPQKYQDAIDAMRSGKFEQARKWLVPFSKTVGEKAIHSIYWIGHCFFQEKQYEKAVIMFSNFLSRVDEIDCSGITSDMKKQANKHLVSCFVFLYRPIDAHAVLDKIEQNYPSDHEYVQEMRAKIKK